MSKQELIRYIRSMLGEPTIQIEVSDEQISQIIDDTIRMYTDVVFGDFEQQEVLHTDMLHNQAIKLPRFTNIFECLSLNGRQTYLFHWNNINRIFTLKSDLNNEKFLIVGSSTFVQNDENDFIFLEPWVKDFAKAKTKYLWGNIVGKYSQSLVGGASINYDRLIQEAETEMEQLKEELKDKWVDPSPVLVSGI